MDVVRPIWEEDANGKCAIDEWNWRFGNTRKKLRGWVKNVDAAYRKEKKHYLLDEGFEYERNLKFILCLFEQMSGLKIIFPKSEVFCLENAKI
jgi:hypothetical protein